MEYKKCKKKFTLSKKQSVAKAAIENRKKIADNPASKKWDDKKRKWTNPHSQIGFKAMTVRELFSDIKDEPNDSKDFKNALKFVDRCVKLHEDGEFVKEGNVSTSKYRVIGAGPPQRAVDVRYALFEYFVNIRNSLKGRLPKNIFLAKARALYLEWVEGKKTVGEEIGPPLTFTHVWLRGWCQEFNVSIKHPNKRFKISAADRKARIIR